jgi:hypothetical protein
MATLQHYNINIIDYWDHVFVKIISQRPWSHVLMSRFSFMSNLLTIDIIIHTQFLKLHLNWSDLLCMQIEP